MVIFVRFSASDYKCITETERRYIKDITTSTEERSSNGRCCGTCGKLAKDCPSGKLMTCSACKVSKYCSRECQEEAWEMHKPRCKLIRENETYRAMEQKRT
jgi:hypothetical protein